MNESIIFIVHKTQSMKAQLNNKFNRISSDFQFFANNTCEERRTSNTLGEEYDKY